MLRVLTLASLFPDHTRPTFGPFVERQTLGLAAHPDVELRVVSPVGLPPWPFSHHPRYRAFAALPLNENWKGVTVYRPRFTHIPGASGRFDAAAIARACAPLLRSIRKEFAFDVIDAEFFFPDGPAAVRLGELFTVPVSIKARGADIQFWGVQSATRRQILDAAKQANGLLAVASALKGDMVALGMEAEKIRVHYTGVDLALFKAGERAAAKGELGVEGPLVVSVGALIPRKRQEMTLAAVAMLEGATLVLIGRGEDEAMLHATAAKLGMTHRVKILGALPQPDIARWLSAADVMCLPSKSEGLANAWVEALASGTPVVTTDVGGARELMDRADAGHIVAAEVETLAAAMDDLISNPRDPFAVRAVAERFTWEANTDALYRHLCVLSGRESPQSD